VEHASARREPQWFGQRARRTLLALDVHLGVMAMAARWPNNWGSRPVGACSTP
jgi:hypothetical protein